MRLSVALAVREVGREEITRDETRREERRVVFAEAQRDEGRLVLLKVLEREEERDVENEEDASREERGRGGM